MADKGDCVFSNVSDSLNFSKEEEKVLAYWSKIKAFETSFNRSVDEKLPEYTFYDGPPFATGLPHYGHILAGTIKDTVTRYAHQTGHKVVRRFGWDCHGLPVEYEIDKKLGIKSPDDVAKLGIDKYNEECRSIVMRYSSEWESIVTRLGRWIDFKNDYKTLDTSFMESVWWVFSQLYAKGLVYQGFKVMPYSTACHTPLSNFEAGQNYKNVSDPAVTVTFPIISDNDDFKGCMLLAWTTTPWTLPSNLALCVNEGMEYIRVHDKERNQDFIFAKERLNFLYPQKKKKAKKAKKSKKKSKKDNKKETSKTEERKESPYQILKSFTGKDLIGLKYKPLFNCFDGFMNDTKEDVSNVETAYSSIFTVVSDNYVSAESGTGIVHQAPAFGEDDYRVCLKFNVIQRKNPLFCPIDSSGKFTKYVKDFQGVHVKVADKGIIKLLKENNRLFKSETIVHSYPHCWRSDTPLIYRAVPSWFVDVPSLRDRLLVHNKSTYWVPAFVSERRFHNWLEDAREWSISRNRYWGTPLPIWMNDDGEIRVISSREELMKAAGLKELNDLHRHFIDDIVIPSSKPNGKPLRRVPEVFDCWFESGSMPYAQQHYPFENKDTFEQNFPADFIAEGLDQTRGWFYTLLVISTALFDCAPYKNIVVNGLVLAADGKKMSKRLKNYPDPLSVVNKYGADAIRLYLINSPVVRAEPLKFKEEGVYGVLREVFLPWYNSYRLFVSQSRSLELSSNSKFVRDPNAYQKSNNIMDKWISAAFQTLVNRVRNEMAKYRLDTVVPHLVRFIDQLSKWYIRFNKLRIKGVEGPENALISLQVLYEVLLNLCKLMAPFTPFFVEFMYQNLANGLSKGVREDSVHYHRIPLVEEKAFDEDIEKGVEVLQQVIDLGRAAREKSNQLSFRFPYPNLIILNRDEMFVKRLTPLKNYILDELNVKNCEISTKLGDFVLPTIEQNHKVLGKKLKNLKKPFGEAVKKLTVEDGFNLVKNGELLVKFGEENKESLLCKLDVDLFVSLKFNGDEKAYSAISKDGLVVIVHKVLNEECMMEGIAREIISRVQRARKEANLTIEDKVDLFIQLDEKAPECTKAYNQLSKFIDNKLRQPLRIFKGDLKGKNIVFEGVKPVLKESVRVVIVRRK